MLQPGKQLCSVMRLVPLLALALGGCIASNARNISDSRGAIGDEQIPGQYFVFLYRPGPAWVKGKSIREQPVLAHAAHMAKLEREGTLLIGGPFKDDAGAFGILHCANLEAARKLIDADPAIRDQLMTAEVHPWFPATAGCLDPKRW